MDSRNNSKKCSACNNPINTVVQITGYDLAQHDVNLDDKTTTFDCGHIYHTVCLGDAERRCPRGCCVNK